MNAFVVSGLVKRRVVHLLPNAGADCFRLNRSLLAGLSAVQETMRSVVLHAPWMSKLDLEGIVSKRKDSPYRSGRSPDWLKAKNPPCAATTREAEEDWPH
jgi:hypothetical protein